MRIGITGGTGFIGSALVRTLLEDGHDIVIVSRGERPLAKARRDSSAVTIVETSILDRARVSDAFDGCDSVVHLAGINREQGSQTYEHVHIRGTKAVIDATLDAGCSTLVLSSYLRARPNCGSGYHESKWRAEQLVRESSLDATVVKPAAVYGEGDQLLTHVARALWTAPVFPTVGFGDRHLRPVAVDDLVTVLAASTVDGRLSGVTVPVMGPERLTLTELVRRIGAAIDRKPYFVPFPVRGQYATAWVQEQVMETPIVSMAAIRMLAEGMTDPAPESVCDDLPADLEPTQPFSTDHLKRELPETIERIGLDDFEL